MGWDGYDVGMNIYCEWSKEVEGVLIIWSGDKRCGSVVEDNGEPVLSGMGYNFSFTFNELEYLMDNWYNLPRV